MYNVCRCVCMITIGIAVGGEGIGAFVYILESSNNKNKVCFIRCGNANMVLTLSKLPLYTTYRCTVVVELTVLKCTSNNALVTVKLSLAVQLNTVNISIRWCI